MTAATAELRIDGHRYDGWLSLSVTRSMETASGELHAEFSERWPGQTVSRPIAPDAEAIVRLDGETVLSGHVYAVSPGYDDGGHQVTLTARDLAGDLVDCVPMVDPGEWHSIGLEQLATVLSAPFGVDVRADVDLGRPFAKFRVDEGETAWSAIERACRARQVLCMSNGQGAIVLTRAGRQRAGSLRRGGDRGNILVASSHFSYAERFSRTVVKAQRPGRDDEDATARAHVIGEAEDREVRRYRPTLILADRPMDTLEARQLAAWHANIAAARARRVTVAVVGWRDGYGNLWRPNRLTRIDCDWLRLACDMLIVTVRQRISDDGEITEMELMRADAFTPQPPSGKEKDEPGWQ